MMEEWNGGISLPLETPFQIGFVCTAVCQPTTGCCLLALFVTNGTDESMEFLFYWWDCHASLSHRHQGPWRSLRRGGTQKKTLLEARMLHKNLNSGRNSHGRTSASFLACFRPLMASSARNSVQDLLPRTWCIGMMIFTFCGGIER